jgi:hypothetical protein
MNKSANSRRPAFLGLLILILVIAGAFLFSTFQQNNQPPKTVKGFVGGEKINFLENEEVKKILREKYRLKIDINKAGSLDMIRASHENVDFLFPSNQTALELYLNTIGPTYKDDIIFNTPIVLYSHKLVADALVQSGLAESVDGVYQVKMQALVDKMAADATWADVNLPQLFGPLTVDTTDPAKSNSGNMFSGLVANMLNGGQVVTEKNTAAILPDLLHIFSKLGYMETSSSDLFNQFLKTGVGAKPLVAGYENQLLEFSKLNPEAWQKVKDDIVILYPQPTVWSTHILIALDAAGEELMIALKDDRIQQIAWDQHGFRTGVYTAKAAAETFDVPGVSADITQIIQMPNQKAMEQIISAFQ